MTDQLAGFSFVSLVVHPQRFFLYWWHWWCSGPASIDDRYLRRKRSSADLGTNYPGDLLSLALPKPRPVVPPLLKRNTIGDFASTRAYQQASTASLVSPSATAFDQGLYDILYNWRISVAYVQRVQPNRGPLIGAPHDRKCRTAVRQFFSPVRRVATLESLLGAARHSEACTPYCEFIFGA